MHWFGVPGIANGLAVLRDEESNSLWDHITGECFEGPLTGTKMDFWPVSLTNVSAELEAHPDSTIYHSTDLPFWSRMMRMFMSLFFGKDLIESRGARLMPDFRRSMHREIDPRQPEMAQGLGVIWANNEGKFYPMHLLPKGGQIEDVWNGRVLTIERGEKDGVPFARWKDSNEPPMQLLTRWYGFSFTYPDCEIYEAKNVKNLA